MSHEPTAPQSPTESKRLLKLAFEANSDYLSYVRHEFRTPLNQILGYGEMLEEDAASAGQASVVSDLQRIQKASRRLLELVDAHLTTKFLNLPPVAPPESSAANRESSAANRSPNSSDIDPDPVEK